MGTFQGFDAFGDVIPQWGYVDVVIDGVWTPAALQAEVYPSQGGTIDLGTNWGEASLEIPPGPGVETLTINYMLVPLPGYSSTPTQTVIGEFAIRLESNVAPGAPVTLTIRYDEADIAGVDESTLQLLVWNSGAWMPADTCGDYVRDVDNNVLEVVLCHFSDYVLVGERAADEQKLHLPIILKNN